MTIKPIILLLLCSTLLFPQIVGVVKDVATNKPIEGVNITGENAGTSTDVNGRFILNIPIGSELTFSHIGYQSIKVPADKECTILLRAIVLPGKEIIVSAGLRDEYLQRTTSSVTVFNSETIQRTDGSHFQEIMEAIPNLTAAGGTSRPRYFQIRGMGERSHYFGEGPPNFSVGFTIDDIDLSGLGMVGLLYDLNQIEVHKGPQSSVFGPNALAGLIRMTSTNPEDTFSAGASVTNGTDRVRRFDGRINIPLGKYFAFRTAIESGYGDGFRTNQYLNKTNTNGRKENIIREKFLLKPNNNFQALLTAFRAVLDNKYDVWAPDNNKDLFTYTNHQGIDSQETNAYSLRANYTKNLLSASLIVSQSISDIIHAYDGDWGNDDFWAQAPYYFDPNITYWKYEFFDSTSRTNENQTLEGRISYGDLVVGYYRKELRENDDASGWLYGGNASLATSEFNFKASAVYGQVDKQLSNNLKILANIRLEKNEINYHGTASYFDWDIFDYVPLDTVLFQVNHDLWGGKLAVQYMIDQDINFYGSISRGYKAGGVNQHPYLSGKNRLYDPESIVSYETGLHYFSPNANIRLSTFYAFRQNQQVSISSQQQEGDPNSFIFYTANATTGSLHGWEMESVFRLNSVLTFSGSLGWLNTLVNEFQFSSASDEITQSGGRASAYAPKYSFSFSIDYSRKKGVVGRLEMTGKDQFYFSDSHNEMSRPYQLVNGHIGYQFNHYSIKVWGRNIFDTRYATRGFYFGLEPVWNEELQEHEYPDKRYVSYGDPAYFGVTVEYGF